jgi:Cu/Ag efflux protein CusF
MMARVSQELFHPDRSRAKASGLRIASNARYKSARRLASLSLFALLASSAACNRAPVQPTTANSSSAAKRYVLKGQIISIDKQTATANINNEPIPSFMDSMVMPYPIKPPAALDQLHPGDSITADVVVDEPGKYWLENVKVTGHSNSAAAK